MIYDHRTMIKRNIYYILLSYFYINRVQIKRIHFIVFSEK